ncbi:hypothetical protein IE81DRAFT_320305 [Ceraceosorus guamensis]|uniref:Uncharacterized protein n=1 Tax=Ceraceosorus guamensis TaxID=1522189 RepID=A0A316W9Y3_9BASI|nr:hypothetical protein IE81DRAFT_320305 [Ceraceosorus guamensis]PWN45541.1 hypothetical protein IE81DRAFT_320305 [Ceraceosorus guamensis]
MHAPNLPFAPFWRGGDSRETSTRSNGPTGFQRLLVWTTGMHERFSAASSRSFFDCFESRPISKHLTRTLTRDFDCYSNSNPRNACRLPFSFTKMNLRRLQQSRTHGPQARGTQAEISNLRREIPRASRAKEARIGVLSNEKEKSAASRGACSVRLRVESSHLFLGARRQDARMLCSMRSAGESQAKHGLCVARYASCGLRCSLESPEI